VLLLSSGRVAKAYINGRSTVKRADRQPTSDMLEHFSSSAAGLSTIRAFGAVDKQLEIMHTHIDKLALARRYFWIFNRYLMLQMSLIGTFFSIAIGVVILSSTTVVDISYFGAIFTFTMSFSTAMTHAVNFWGTLESYMDAAEAVMGYNELETEDQGGIEVPEDWPSKGKVEVQGLDLAYSVHLPLVLKGVSFVIEGGRTIGIAGRTGAGKSSLTLSLLRLIEPRNGSIIVDGIDISTVKLLDLRTRIAFIPQDPVLFSGTIRSNLDYFREIPEEQLIDALRRVKLLAEDGDVKSGLFTLDSPISAGGANMSQGQRQLLCLARVLLKKPRIMILDEATSAVDNKTDLMIQETIKQEFSGTLIVVAHRLRTIMGFDEVMVMSDGKIGEIGKPEKLLRDKGMFYKLVEESQDRNFLRSMVLE
jgi:ABC-type multidrug transport system fused ATPase/permease subunit